jgi:amino acid transporter
VLKGFRSRGLSRAVGLLVIAVGLVSAAAIASGSVGYLRHFIDLPPPPLLALVVFAMAAIAAYGIVESTMFTAILSTIEIGGLVVIIMAAFLVEPEPIAAAITVAASAADPAWWPGILAAGLLAFFAFIGFESLANVAEEARLPHRTMPLAILLTLGISTFLYMALAAAAVIVVTPAELAGSPAPLSLVFERATGLPPRIMSLIAILATLNGVVVQLIMVSRLMHGMAGLGTLPALLGRVNVRTRTPLTATATAAVLVYLAALALPLERLAEATSLISLVIFALVNLALIVIKRRDGPPPEDTFEIPLAVPAIGLLTCLGLIATALWL